MLKHRKMLLVFPILVLPFLTAIFWAMGGGTMTAANFTGTEKKGFNLKLPDANLKEGIALDKMHYYNQAALDSAKFDELIKKDPNYPGNFFSIDSMKEDHMSNYKKGKDGLNISMYHDPNEEKVYKKLEALQNVINSPDASRFVKSPGRSSKTTEPFMHSDDIERLEKMMESMNSQSGEQDPEIDQLSGMLENILDIQHPGRVQEKLRKVSEQQRGQVFSMTVKTKDDNITSLQNNSLNMPAFKVGPKGGNGFYSFDEATTEDYTQNAVTAVIHETQTVVNGAIVKMRLANDILINGIQIPKDNFLFGTASLKGERLTITITSIRYNNTLFPVDLSVYDMDGLLGIYIPGAINRDVAKASADRSMQTLGVASLDDSWGAQAAGAGIEAAKNLLSKKVKLVKVVVKAGYQVLLHDEKQKQKSLN